MCFLFGAHPRSRGEHAMTRTLRFRMRGSSPLTRGALLLGVSLLRVLRLIPAHAGSTSLVHGVCFLFGAHPRSRGEHRWVSSK
nr:hypothetical protein HMPREF0276_1794 [Corynebacterium accolens ATCC 49725]